MIPAQFDYVAPTTVEEALAALAEHGDDAKIIAGGQSLLPVLRMRLNAPEMVIDLGRIDVAARRPRRRRRDRDRRDDPARRGRLATRWSHEHAAADHQGGRAPRRRRRSGTAARSAARSRTPTRPATWARRRWRSGAEFVIAGSGGTRTVAADDFFVDLFETAIGEDEILTEVRIPKHTGWGAHYEKFVRVAHQWPIVAVAAAVRVDGGTIAEARVGLTNMGSTPLRARGGRGGAGRAAGHRGRASGPRPSGPPRAPTRRPTSTATPTTGGTWPAC